MGQVLTQYSPKPILGNDPETRINAIVAELQEIGRAFTIFSLVPFAVLNAAPPKLRVGMVVYADGTNWNPDAVSGEGLYVYKSGGWTFIV